MRCSTSKATRRTCFQSPVVGKEGPQSQLNDLCSWTKQAFTALSLVLRIYGRVNRTLNGEIVCLCFNIQIYEEMSVTKSAFWFSSLQSSHLSGFLSETN